MNEYYKYKGLQILKDRFDKNTNLYDNIHICAYDVNNQGKYPFHRFLLINTEQNNMLKLPTVTMPNKFLTNSNSNTYNNKFINLVKVSLFGLFQLYIDDFAALFNGVVQKKAYFRQVQLISPTALGANGWNGGPNGSTFGVTGYPAVNSKLILGSTPSKPLNSTAYLTFYIPVTIANIVAAGSTNTGAYAIAGGQM